jgi:hypothetical protein
VERTRRLFIEGKPLLQHVTPALRFELALTWNGGVAILKKIEQAGYAVQLKRQHLSFLDKLSVFGLALRSP